MEYYFRAKTRTLKGFFKQLSFSFITAFIVFLMTVWYFRDAPNILLIGLGFSCAIFLALFVSLLQFPDYVITPKEVRFVKGRKVLESFPYDKYHLDVSVSRDSAYGLTQYQLHLYAELVDVESKNHTIHIEPEKFNDFSRYIKMYTEQYSDELKRF